LELLRLKDYKAFIELAAVMWVGRGDLAPRDFESEASKNSRMSFTVDYLVNKSGRLVQHLETGLWALGYPAHPEQKWIEEYKFQRHLDQDPDYPREDRSKPKPRDPIVSIDQFGSGAAPLKHLTIGDVSTSWRSTVLPAAPSMRSSCL
jgi:hypothetical protein